jgi:hypothetical protein
MIAAMVDYDSSRLISPDFSQVKKIIDKERKKGSLFDT